MELVEIIRGGQDAMDRGDYRLAVAASSHVLETFPSCLTAHRMLGEAHLEQGQTDTAIDHFNRAIAIDPLNVVARLGLGVAAEENKAMEDAYSAYLHAWEINPALDQVRDELVRLRGLLGGNDRLHPTRAGLAGIYIRGGQFGRAAAEWRSVLAAEPDNRRARTSLAEILWRSGDEAGALTACREVLRDSPENARALGIVADIETRRGAAEAADYVDRFQFVDPAGEILALLSEWRDDLDLSFLRRERLALPEFDFSVTPLADRAPVSAAPVMAALSGAPGLGSSQFAAPDLWDSLVQDLKPGEEPSTPGTAIEDDVMPFTWQDDAAPISLLDENPFSVERINGVSSAGAQALPGQIGPSDPVKAPSALSFEDEFAEMTSGGFHGAPEAMAERSPELERTITATTPAAEPAQVHQATRPKPSDDQFVTADGRVDLTVGWDDLDRQLKDATPTFDDAMEMDELAAQLGVEGIQPFDAGESPFDESAWAPFTNDDFDASAEAKERGSNQFVPGVPAAQFNAEAPALDSNAGRLIAAPDVEPRTVEPAGTDTAWGMHDELVSAIPSQQASGYTEILRHVDTEVPQELVAGEEVDPFANPDSAGTPLEFEDLLAVTSSDGTSELTWPEVESDLVEFPRSETDPWADELAAVQHMAETGWPAEAIPDLPLDQSPFDLEELLRGESTPATVRVESEEFGLAELPGDDHLDAMIAGLGDVQPFMPDDSEIKSERAHDIDVVDFSEINEAPFEPSRLAGAPPVIAPMAVASHAWEPAAEHAVPAVEISPMWSEVEPASIHDGGLPKVHDLMVTELDPEHTSAPSRLGLAPGGVAWPAFVSHTSLLIDRGTDRGNLFARLRESKRTAVAPGLTVIARSLSELRPAAVAVAEPALNVQGHVGLTVRPSATIEERRARFGSMTEEERLDLMAMRIRLIEDDGSAEEVAQVLEAAIARGMNDPLALRVLGEAYLKLGRTDQAANQFRNAMLARQRAR